ncbi:MAG: anion permease, partial [Butyrivibrio sp.]|nr:anion permease [Butyrivibrio sp.]
MKTKNTVKKLDTVMCIAWLLAIISSFFVLPDKKYIDYIDFKSLGILWGLMVIIQGFKENSVFEWIANSLLTRVKKSWQLAAMLIFICFFGSMLITNDVALITFVPFAIMMLARCGRHDMLIPVIVLQTIAANLGCMLTPIGNPQNLFMYGLTGIILSVFLLLMLPYSIMAFLMLCICIFFIPGRAKEIAVSETTSIVSKFG